MNFTDIKRDYPIRATVESIIGDRLRKRTHTYDQYLCPFHADSQSSFTVYDTQCTCWVGCPINGAQYGDVLDFIKELYKLPTLKHAAEQLTGKFPDPPQMPPLPKKTYVPKLTWGAVQKGITHQADAFPYFEGRGLHKETVVEYNMGKYTEWTHHSLIAGQDHAFTAARFTLPDVAFGRVRSIELRLDEHDARQRLTQVDAKLLALLADEFAINKGTAPTELDLIYALYGAKYLQVPGGVSANLIFNAPLVIQRIDYQGVKGWFSPDMPYVLVHEGRLKALYMQQHGYPSISAKGATRLGGLYGVKRIIIVKDNDKAGEAYANRNLECTLRKLGQGVEVITAPEGCKAADDVPESDLYAWMYKNGIEPCSPVVS